MIIVNGCDEAQMKGKKLNNWAGSSSCQNENAADCRKDVGPGRRSLLDGSPPFVLTSSMLHRPLTAAR